MSIEFEDRGIISAPLHGNTSTTHHHRDHQQMLAVFNRPVDGQANRAAMRALVDGLCQHRIGSGFRIKPLRMEQTRQALGGGFLIVKTAGSLRLAGGLFLHDGANEIGHTFELMTVCPR